MVLTAAKRTVPAAAAGEMRNTGVARNIASAFESFNVAIMVSQKLACYIT
jgi:hypothetical protein